MVPPEELQVAVRQLLAGTGGEVVALSRLQMSIQTVARIGAGFERQPRVDRTRAYALRTVR